MKISSTAACLLLLAACGSSRAPQPTAPVTGTSPKQVIATFVGEVDPASGTMTLRTTPTTTGRTSLRSSLATSRKSLVVPDSLVLPDTVTVQNEGAPAVVTDGCGPGVNSFSGTVRVTTNFPTTVLQNVYAEILTISQTGREGCTSVAPPLGDSAPGGVSAAYGLWQYGTLSASGISFQLAEWDFALPDSSPFSFTGRIVATLEDTFSVGTGLVGIAYDTGTGTIWVTDANDGSLPGSVMKLDAASGDVLATTPVGTNPVAVTADGAGGIWVANWTDNTVTKLNAVTGALVDTYPVGVKPQAVAADDADGIWVANSGDGTVTKLQASNGTPIGSPIGGFVEPYAVAFASSTHSVWVVDAGAETVTQLSTDGVVLGGPFAVGAFPQAVTADGSGGIWVANNVDATVTRLTAAGAFVATYSAGLGPVGIASDGSGSIWVADKDIPVIRLSAANGSVVAQYDVSASQSQVVALAGTAWIANGDGTVIRLKP
jgi:DNA-binding beta-propeller fold protein YncE